MDQFPFNSESIKWWTWGNWLKRSLVSAVQPSYQMKSGMCYCVRVPRCNFLLSPLTQLNLPFAAASSRWGRPLLLMHPSVTRLCTLWTSHKCICYPLVQFIELSEMSGPARPLKGPVRWKMEREALWLSISSTSLQKKEFLSELIDYGSEYRWFIGNGIEGKSSCSTGNQWEVLVFAKLLMLALETQAWRPVDNLLEISVW